MQDRTPPSPTQIRIGWHDHRPFLGSPTTDPLERLARVRADGSLEPVEPGSLVGAPRIFVFAHGWVPGARTMANVIEAESGVIPRAWDDGVVDMYGFTLVEAYVPLMAAIAERDLEAAVLWFSWVDESSTDGQVFAAGQSLSRAHVNGTRLAIALVMACAAELPPVHLIGHSHGCVVVSHAALALPQLPAQVTLLDCPEDWISRAGGAAGMLTQVLPRLGPGRGQGEVFVDSYTSMFGRAYHRRPGLSDVVDVRLADALRPVDARGPVGDAHEFAVSWYADTVRASDPRCGFAWSVLDAQRRRDAGDDPGFDPGALAAAYLVQGDGAPVSIARRRPVPSPWAREVAPLGIGTIELTADRPDVMIAAVLPEAEMVEFAYQLHDPERNSRVEAAVERVPAFLGGSGARAIPRRGQYLRLPTSRPPDVPVLIQFRLAGAGAATRATISDLVAVSTGIRVRNYDPTRTAVSIGLVGAGLGAAATLAALGVARLLTGRSSRG